MFIKVFVFVTLFVAINCASTCPSVCVCKWKGGKQNVECINAALITIPEYVDPETQVLDMTNNNLQILPREIFHRAGLSNLQKVFLRSCRLGQIDDQAFKGLTNLVDLDLSYNLLTSIPSATFQDIPFLRELILSGNPIQKIEGNSFRTVPTLVKLDLSACDIQMIAPKAFEGLDLLETLKLNGNKLTELRPRTVEMLTRLHWVELHGNPWICDCRLRAAKLWLSENKIPYPIPPACDSGPERVLHRTFVELQVDDFACKPEILPVSRYIEAVAGDNATVVCKAGAVPAAQINWYWNGRQLQNNTAFSSYQRIFIFEEGHFEKQSTLVLTNAQETDSSEFYCVAENRAGNAEANFTVHITMRAAGMANLRSSQIVGLSAALFMLILFILLVILILLIRLRRVPQTETKTPTLEVVTVVNSRDKTPTIEQQQPPLETNPVQKPPRLTELISPTLSSGNNPDLIINTNRDEFEISELERPGSGEYRNVCESLYPSGLWETQSLRRILSSSYDDKTPIIDDEFEEQYRGVSAGYPADYGLPIVPGAGDPNGPVPMVPPHLVPTTTNAKVLRVWQKGGVPVLPPVTALKRALSNRNSPDEGYQEGCGTDV